MEGKQGLLLALLSECSTAMRERSQAEYAYIAAAIAGFGAVSWGVAALSSHNFSQKFLLHPAIAAIIGIVFTTAVIIVKIILQHLTFKKIRTERIGIATKLAALPETNDLIPKSFLEQPTGFGKYCPGALMSCLVLCTAAISSIYFCWTVFKI